MNNKHTIKRNITAIEKQLGVISGKFDALFDQRESSASTFARARMTENTLSKIRKIKPILEKNKHKFNVWEWMAIRETLNI